jgi:hypothetical protein
MISIMKNLLFYFTLSVLLFLGACSAESTPKKNDYQLAVEQSLASGEQANGLVGGLSFGMNQATFFDYCQKQQKLGRMTDGADNMVRVYVDSSAMPGQAVLEFYPDFNEKGEINLLKGRLYSLQWSPWAPQFNASNLLQEGQDYLLEQLGGAGFKQYESVKGNTFVKLDGNRRVVLYAHEFAQERLVFLIHNLLDAPEDVFEGVDLSPIYYPTLTDSLGE